MKTYSDELKATLVEKMLPPQNMGVLQLAQETGIPKDTLYTWRSQARRAHGLAVLTQAPPAEQWSSAAKFAVVVETAALTEAELSAYCRQKGLYPEQVAGWRQACQQANGVEALSRPAERARAQGQAKKINPHISPRCQLSL